ncbi:MAG: hypothetical protein D6732_04275, partial [Methanobacteriota archaeon]
KHFDLYNPILNKFKLDSLSRKSYPEHYDFDVYYEADTLRYMFFRTESYGYLHKFFYQDGKLFKVKIYPILAGKVDEGAKIITNWYFYYNNELVAVRDDLNKELYFVNGDMVTIYDGILDPGNGLKIFKKKVSDFYIRLLNSGTFLN